MLRVKAAISTMGAMVIGFFIFAISDPRKPRSNVAMVDNVPPHRWLEMPIAYGGDASTLSSLVWEIRVATLAHLVPTSDNLSLDCRLCSRARMTPNL